MLVLLHSQMGLKYWRGDHCHSGWKISMSHGSGGLQRLWLCWSDSVFMYPWQWPSGPLQNYMSTFGKHLGVCLNAHTFQDFSSFTGVEWQNNYSLDDQCSTALCLFDPHDVYYNICPDQGRISDERLLKFLGWDTVWATMLFNLVNLENLEQGRSMSRHWKKKV